ncbi:MAG: hypothetical protein AAB265_10555, partial [candidate division NC10 bacterium]
AAEARSRAHTEALVAGLRRELLQEIAAAEARSRAHTEALVAGLRQELLQEIAAAETRGRAHTEAIAAQLGRQIQAEGVETRRHFEVVGEAQRSALQIVAEGVLTLDRKHDSFRAEVHEEFAKVDRRFLRLEARVLSPEERN